MCDSPRSVRLKRMLSVAAGSREKELLSSRNCHLPITIIFPLLAEVPENCISENRINGLSSGESGEAESLNQSNLTTGSYKVLRCSSLKDLFNLLDHPALEIQERRVPHSDRLYMSTHKKRRGGKGRHA